MNAIYLWFGRLPIRNFIEVAVIITSAALVLTLFSGCAHTDTKAPEPLTPHDVNASRALALQKIGESAKDAETQRLAIFAVMAMGQNAPQQQTVIQPPRTVGEAVVGFFDRTFERALSIVPAFLAYKGQVKQADTTSRVAEINRDVSINQSNNFLGLGVAGIQGTAITGIAGANALATVANRPTTSVTGNTGPVNLGNGTQTNSSNNPVNAIPKVCATVGTGATATLVCQ
jgi:hypothetical protein